MNTILADSALLNKAASRSLNQTSVCSAISKASSIVVLIVRQDDVMNKVVDSTGGFGLVLAAAKAYLEHDIDLNIVADRF